MYTANPENIRRTSGFKEASASSTNVYGGLSFGLGERVIAILRMLHTSRDWQHLQDWVRVSVWAVISMRHKCVMAQFPLVTADCSVWLGSLDKKWTTPAP